MRELPDGLYERIIDLGGAALLREAAAAAQVEPLSKAEASRRLARAVHDYLLRALEEVRKDDRPRKQLEICNAIIKAIEGQLADFVGNDDYLTGDLLLSLLRDRTRKSPPRPTVPLSESALFVNASRERRIGSELAVEIASADEVDLLCPFLFWQGYRELRGPILDHLRSGRRFRVLTSTYCGMTQPRVLDDLARHGAEIRVSYETKSTRLHAKAWHFRRRSGFSTAFIGSSNLSKVALTSGLEWNVRLSEIENRGVLDEFGAAFENYWSSPDFQDYDPEVFVRHLGAEHQDDRLATLFAVRPYTYQKVILDRLATEREAHDRHRNLVVAATGTGKTVIAALDYKNLCRERPLSLLFVAHRKEILTQARDTFRHAMGDGSFGELCVGGLKPSDWRQVFASVQSLKSEPLDDWPRDRFDVVIIDEFHHASENNRTYERILSHLEPRELLGLTATPERTDGIDILHWFGGRIAAEVRLWDAIDRGLLVPFQYFGVHDNTDLEQVDWRSGRYDPRQLEDLYDGNDARAHLVAKAIAGYVEDPSRMRALGFCAGRRHAHYMAAAFDRSGLKAAVILGDTAPRDRQRAIDDLRGGKISVIFAVDVFNEGVDIPEIDTLLFLRPTESALLFTQQLGRGLRHAKDKRCLTVLDFVGKANRRFRYDRRFRALTGSSRRELKHQIEQRFPYLPAGCSIELDRASKDIVLENLKQAVGNSKTSLLAELRQLGDVDLATFLREAMVELEDVYRAGRCWTELRRAAGLPAPPEGPLETKIGRALGRLIHVDDVRRIRAWRAIVTGETVADPARGRLELMLATALLGAEAALDVEGSLDQIRAHVALTGELKELLAILEERIDHRSLGFCLGHEVPLEIHGRYSLAEIMAAFGDVRDRGLYEPREGVVYHGASRCNLLFVTLTKDEDDYSPSTMYNDYAISESRFHWESQSRTRPHDEKGRRHVEHATEGITPLLFVRVHKKDDRGMTCPYTFLGPVNLESWKGERPMKIEWALEHPMPTALFQAAAVASA